MIARFAVAFVVLVCAALGASYLYFMTYSPDRTTYPLRGIDVSHHQGSIDWRRVAADDVSFAFLKATEGGDHVDRRFAENFAAARQAGIAVGAYHFFTFCRPGADQAANFLDTVPHDGKLLPPVVDIEFGGNCATRPAAAEFTAELMAFLDPVEAAFGQPALVYVIGDAIDVYGTAIPERPRWVRSLASHPGHDEWAVWQYHNRGHVDGIEGDVDLNVLNGGSASLASMLSAPQP